MSKEKKVAVIIPALNEARSIGLVLDSLPGKSIDRVVVVDGGSRDKTVEIARQRGAIVLQGPTAGYGHACLTGIRYLRALNPHTVVFLDGDFSDYPEEVSLLLDPILKDKADFVVGSRLSGLMEPGAMPVHAVWGNRFSCFLVDFFYGYPYTDLGPFRAIRYDKLLSLKMKDLTYGWTVEMQVKAVKAGLKITEVPVRYRKRVGISKISGSLAGSIKAGIKIIFTILRWK